MRHTQKIKRIFLFCTAAAFITAQPVSGESKYGTTGGQILEVDSSARAAALGYAFTGLADGYTGALYNPAGLTQLSGPEIEISHMRYYEETHMSSIGSAHKLGQFGLAAHIKQFSATDTERDYIGNRVDDFTIAFRQFTVAAGYPMPDEGASLGAAVNIITENIHNDSGTGFSLTGGWHYLLPDGSSYGLTVRNAGTGIKTSDSEADFPLEAAVGGAYRPGKFILLWEAATSRQFNFAFRSGIQANMSREFCMRFGFTYLTRPEFTVGFGINVENWVVDYAFLLHADLGMAHRISLGFKL